MEDGNRVRGFRWRETRHHTVVFADVDFDAAGVSHRLKVGTGAVKEPGDRAQIGCDRAAAGREKTAAS
jgi:hypothetical protein